MTEQHDELEQHLRALFDDDRLAVRAAPGARDAVVAGARRARRRRELAVAGSGVAVVVIAAAGGLLLTAPPSGDKSGTALAPGASLSAAASSPSAPPPQVERKPEDSPAETVEPSTTGEIARETRPSSTPPPEPSSEPPRVPMTAGGPIGPSGFADLELGMSFAQAQQTGYIAPDAPAPQGCTSYSLTTGTEFVSAVLISESGLGRFVAAEGGRSPEDEGIGSPIEELQAAYPAGKEEGGEFSAETGTGARYVFTMGEDAVADQFALTNGGC